MYVYIYIYICMHIYIYIYIKFLWQRYEGGYDDLNHELEGLRIPVAWMKETRNP